MGGDDIGVTAALTVFPPRCKSFLGVVGRVVEVRYLKVGEKPGQVDPCKLESFWTGRGLRRS